MKLRDIHSAKGLKFKLCFSPLDVTDFKEGQLVNIKNMSSPNKYYVEPFGLEKHELSSDNYTGQCIDELLNSEEQQVYHCLFEIESVYDEFIEIQSYLFRSLTEYKTPIAIKVPADVLDNRTIKNIEEMFIWDGFNMPAIFALSEKSNPKKNADISLISDKLLLNVQNNANGLTCSKISYIKKKEDLPIDVYIAPEIKFLTGSDINTVNDKFSADLEKISSAATYFARWEAYNSLEEKLIQDEADKFGSISYSHVDKITEIDGTTFKFTIAENEISKEYIKRGLVAETGGESDNCEDSKNKRKGISVGDIQSIEHDKLTTYKLNNDYVKKIPENGQLRLDTRGDESVIKRRDKAKERMLGYKSPIKTIVRLIEEGVAGYSTKEWDTNESITSKLRRNFAEIDKFNEEQKTALNIAINSPDIVVIQGPPGTGKTTVIKAICERFREIYEGKERQKQKENEEYVVSRPKILISSFQNEAVDNAVAKPLPGDMPATRLSREGAIKNQYKKSLEVWLENVNTQIKGRISSTAPLYFVEKRRCLFDEFASYKNAGEKIEVAISLIKKYLSIETIDYPSETLRLAKSIVGEYKKTSMIEEEVKDPIVDKLSAQRLNRKAFDDDGSKNANRLKIYLQIRTDLSIENADKAAIAAVCNGSINNTIFDNYVKVCKKLIKQFCAPSAPINTLSKNNINKCLMQLAQSYSAGYIDSIDDIDARKALIVGEFLESLENEYETLVEKYSLTTAATCQTCLRMDNKEDEYDLVIIDEAARANPLDLFIPMSMGKKIILVGDHKQLPQMLEPDVLKEILNDEKYKDLPGIDISLFERLFNMFLSDKRPKSIMLKQQYRMNPDICNFVSQEFYDGSLETKITREERQSTKESKHGKALAFVDIPKSKYGCEANGQSKSRPIEVEAIFEDVKIILDNDSSATIGIITFYSAQEKKLKEKEVESGLDDVQLEKIEIGTVDAFQGREFDYVLLSCVRANYPRNNTATNKDVDDEKIKKERVGFLMKPNRLCVAFSRAKKQLIVYGDADTLQLVPCFKNLCATCKTEDGGYYNEY